MRFDYFIRLPARRDIDDAWLWYEEQQAGRGDEFLIELHERISELRDNPFLSCLVSRIVRAVQLPRSRFVIYFRIEGPIILITAVHHARANPQKRRGRK